MTNNKQSQKTDRGSIALQATGDINVGVSMAEVMTIVSQSIQTHTAAARTLVNDRLDEFERRLTDKIARENPKVVEAFSDPDVQGALLDAQRAYTRSSSEDLHAVLTDLIFERANRKEGSRTSLALNDAIKRSANLTKEDFANISLLFHIMNVGVTGKCSPQFVSELLEENLTPLLEHIDLSNDNLEHLYSQGLLLRGPWDRSVKPNPLAWVLKRKYAEAFNYGFSREELNALHPNTSELDITGLIQESPFDPSKVYIPVSDSGLDQMARSSHKLEGFGEIYRSACLERVVSDELFTAEVAKFFPKFPALAEHYDKSLAGVTLLSPTGKAIAHAHLSKAAIFNTPLEIWIKP